MAFFRTLSSPKNEIIYLGTSTTGNIKNDYPNIDYASLTSDNFIVIPGKNIAESEWFDGIDWEHHGGSDFYVDVSATSTYTPTKTYNKSTGAYTCSISTSAGNPGVKVYLYIENKITIPEDLEDTMVYNLGTGTSFNIKTLLPNIDYTKLKVEDFIGEPVSIYSATYGTSDGDHYSDKGTVRPTKTYNSQTGVLTLSNISRTVSSTVPWYGATATIGHQWSATCRMYLVKGTIIN